MKEEKTASAMCGGLISETKFLSDPWAYMMAWYMPDKQYARYVATKDEKKRKQLFDKYARSAI
jgi:hypothetical protein